MTVDMDPDPVQKATALNFPPFILDSETKRQGHPVGSNTISLSLSSNTLPVVKGVSRSFFVVPIISPPSSQMVLIDGPPPKYPLSPPT